SHRVHTTASYSQEWTFDARSGVTGGAEQPRQHDVFVRRSVALPRDDRRRERDADALRLPWRDGDFFLKQIKHMSAGPSPTVLSQFDYTYRQDHAIDTWKIDQGSGATTWTFGYDGARQLTSATRRDASQTVLESLFYSYDKAGNRIQLGTETTAPRNFEVNNLNQ